MNDPLQFQPGQPVPQRADWRFVEKIGAGAFGEVWCIHQPDLDRHEAIKFATSAEAEELLRREAAAMRALVKAAPDHPNIIRVTGVNVDVQPAWIAMEYAPGGSLAQRIAKGAMPPDEVRRVFAGVCAGLDAAHKASIVHGDVKPANILLMADGTPRLTDFGLGTVPDHDQAASAVVNSALQSRLAGPGGTTLFLSPERMAGSEPVPADDVFAVGVSMLHAITGDSTAHPQYARELLAGLNNDLAAAVSNCLAPSQVRPTPAGTAALLVPSLSNRIGLPPNIEHTVTPITTQPPLQRATQYTESGGVLTPVKSPPSQPPRGVRASLTYTYTPVDYIFLGLAWIASAVLGVGVFVGIMYGLVIAFTSVGGFIAVAAVVTVIALARAKFGRSTGVGK